MVTIELTDEELPALRVALVGFLQGQSPTGLQLAQWRTAATGILQRLEPLVEPT